MSKFGYDLPPGVTTSMLPGNTRKDTDHEELYEAIAESARVELPEDGLEQLAVMMENRIGAAYRAGYIAGQSDEAEARRQQEEDGHGHTRD